MQEILSVNQPGFKAKYEVKWFEDTDFSKLKNVKQIYGILFNEKGEILIVNTVGNWQLPGGTPEKNETWEETLIREVKEEASAEIEKITPLGYQIVCELKNNIKGSEFSQLRFAAKIKKLNKMAIDPATNKVPERKFIAVSEFSKYCPWGKISQYIVNKASKTFQSPSIIPITS